MKPVPIDENTPKDRPIIVFAYTSDTKCWPHCVQSCVVEWYETRMREYIRNNRRPGDPDPETRDLTSYKFWSICDEPQGSIDNQCAFEPTHWCEIPRELADQP